MAGNTSIFRNPSFGTVFMTEFREEISGLVPSLDLSVIYIWQTSKNQMSDIKCLLTTSFQMLKFCINGIFSRGDGNAFP